MMIYIYLLLICMATLSSCSQNKPESLVHNFIQKIYIDIDEYDGKKLKFFLNPSDVEILNSLSDEKTKYLQDVIEYYQTDFKKIKNTLNVIQYSQVDKQLLEKTSLLYKDTLNTYCVVSKNKVVGVFILDKNAKHIKSFTPYIPSVGGMTPLVFEEFQIMPNPMN